MKFWEVYLMNMCYLIKPQTNLNPSCWMSPDKLWTALIKFPIMSNRRTKSEYTIAGLFSHH